MMWHRGERPNETGTQAGTGPRPGTPGQAGTGAQTAAGGPGAPSEAVNAAERARVAELMLAAVSTEGLPALVHILLDARSGNADAAAMPVGALLRALPDTSWFTAHDLVSLARITESTTVGELDAVQRSILTRTLNRGPHYAGEAEDELDRASREGARLEPPR
jgi:hypothetical protein